MRAHFDGVFHGRNSIFQIVRIRNFWIKVFKSHNLNLRRDTANSFSITSFGANNAGDVSAVAMIIIKAIIIGNKIPAMDVVYKTILIIVNSVSGFIAPFSIKASFAFINP